MTREYGEFGEFGPRFCIFCASQTFQLWALEEVIVRLPSSARRAPGKILSPETDAHEGRHLRAVVLGEAEAEGDPRTPRQIRSIRAARARRMLDGPGAVDVHPR